MECQPATPTATAAASPVRPRIAICGAGISGLTLAGILSRRMPAGTRIEVFERAPADRDQGYGLDLDEHGQEALVHAGVYHRYWEISKPRSDSWGIYPLNLGAGDIEPYIILYRPALLQWLFPSIFGARPETNRGALRDILLDAIAERPGTQVHFQRGAWAVEELVQSGAGRSGARLLDREGRSLGDFDLVVDAMGLHSTLRQHRVLDPKGKHLSGDTLIHGVIADPERHPGFPKAALEALGQHGTLVAAGLGVRFFMQRFGAGSQDNRTCFFYFTTVDGGERAILEAMGIDRASSRQDGIWTDDRLAKVKAWLHRDMGSSVCEAWHQVVDCLERVTVRDDQTHGDTSLHEGLTLPLVCIGDSLRNCGLGGGGCLAMQDAVELAKCLLRPGAFYSDCRCDLAALVQAEVEMLKRKSEQSQGKLDRNHIFKLLDAKAKVEGHREHCMADLAILVPSAVWRFVARLMLATARPLMKAWHRLDLRRGLAGSTAVSPIYPNVQRALAEQA